MPAASAAHLGLRRDRLLTRTPEHSSEVDFTESTSEIFLGSAAAGVVGLAGRKHLVRSTVATYSGVLDELRRAQVSLDVQFLPDVDIVCPDCEGPRYALGLPNTAA